MKKVKFSDVPDVQIIPNRFQIKEKERFYKYYLILYILCIIGSLVFIFYEKYSISFIFIGFTIFIFLLSNWENCFYLLGFGIVNPYSLSIIPQEIWDYI